MCTILVHVLKCCPLYFKNSLLFCVLQKPYACSVIGCSKKYTDPSSLRKHVKNHSQKETQKKKVSFIQVFIIRL